jgi:hypothetical protein
MATMVTADLEQARQYFAATRTRIVEATTGLSDGQAQFKPSPDRWSIAEILEHMAGAHERVLARVQKDLPLAPAPEADRNAQLIDSVVVEKIPDRTNRFKAPEFLAPTGKLPPSDSLARIFRGYERLITFLESTPDLRGHILESLPLRAVSKGTYSTMDGYQWALATAAHDERHVRQILEVKADSNYPS